MDFMKMIVGFWDRNGTKILGTTSSIISGLIVIPNLIPVEHQPYWSAAGLIVGALTVNRGFTNSAAAAAEIEREQ